MCMGWAQGGEDLLFSPASGCHQYLNCIVDGCLIAWVQGFFKLKKKRKLHILWT